MSSEKTAVMDAVRRLREALGLTQTELARRIRRGMSTVQRWEQLTPPKGEALVRLMELAAENNQLELAELFRDALSRELGYKATIPERRSPNRDDMERIPKAPESDSVILDLIFQFGHPRSGLPLDPVFQEALARWYEIRELIKDLGRKWQSAVATTPPDLHEEIQRRLRDGQSVGEIFTAVRQRWPSKPEDAALMYVIQYHNYDQKKSEG